MRYRGKKSLGWAPLKGRELKREGTAFRFAGNTFRVFYSRPLPDGKITDGTNFSRDHRGHWYLNIVLEVSEAPLRSPVRGVGIDLGLKEFAAMSEGFKVPAPHLYRDTETDLATAQRAGRRKRVKAIHAKIANRRHYFSHTLSRAIVEEFDCIVVGNGNAAGLAKTSMAKSVYGVGWSSFRTQLAYKAVKHGAWFEEVNECFTTQVCSDCGALPDSRPKGIADLGSMFTEHAKEWTCSDCGAVHDRDLNAAKNILRRGRATLAVGIPVL